MKDYKQELISKNTSKAGFKGKVTAKCIECIYDECSTGSWRKQVTECTSKGCPLYEIRPTSSISSEGEEND